MTDNTMKTHLARVRGLGSAKEGSHHWWMQRLTAIALIPLTVWFAISIIGIVGADHAAVVNWFSSPVISIFMILFVSTMVYHSTLGVQVVIEDYIHKERWKFGLLIALKFFGITLGVVAVFSILKLAL
jgi:succinate dehydrogenase / fumarate reductase membrane anchor subunit